MKDQIYKDVLKWLAIYIVAVVIFSTLIIWYLPKLLEALWIVSGLL